MTQRGARCARSAEADLGGLGAASGGGLPAAAVRAHTEAMVLSPEVRSDLEWVRDDFDRLVSNAVGPVLDAPTNGTKWTNRELLFHLWFGQRIARVFIPLIGGFSRLPPGASRAWARLLTAATRPYEWINYAASAAGSRTVPLHLIQSWMRHDTDWLIRWAERASPAEIPQARWSQDRRMRTPGSQRCCRRPG